MNKLRNELFEKGYVKISELIDKDILNQINKLTTDLVNKQSDEDKKKQLSTGSMINVTISEKFTNCIVANTIPIYYGADKVNDIFGNNCCYKLCGDLNKDLELITNIYNNCEKYKLNLEKAQYELFNGNAFLPNFLYNRFYKNK